MLDTLYDDMLQMVRLGAHARESAAAPGVVDLLHAYGSAHARVSDEWKLVVAETVAMPLTVFDIRDTTPLVSWLVESERFLRDGRSEAFLDLCACVSEPQPLAHDIPIPCYAVSPESGEQMRVFRLRRGEAGLIRTGDVLCDEHGCPIVAGLFGVWHRKRLRSIFDRGPPNFTETRLS
jgi:hypothetical protein